jgi:hypothetical protein
MVTVNAQKHRRDASAASTRTNGAGESKATPSLGPSSHPSHESSQTISGTIASTSGKRSKSSHVTTDPTSTPSANTPSYQTPSTLSSVLRDSQGSSSGPRDVAPLGVVEAPVDFNGAPIKDIPAFTAVLLKNMSRAPPDGNTFRRQISRVLHLQDAMVRNHQSEIQALQSRILQLEAEQQLDAAQKLTVNAFDNTLDRMSEGEARTRVEAFNNTIDDFVLNLTEAVSTIPHVQAPTPDISRPDTPLLAACVQLPYDHEHRGLLVDALLHRGLNNLLHKNFFRGQISMRLARLGLLEDVFENGVSKFGESCICCRPFARY